MAYQWPAYLSTKENIESQHCRDAGEKRIGPFKVDGYYEIAQKEKGCSGISRLLAWLFQMLLKNIESSM